MYESYYNLHGKPFQLTPDPELLFPSMGHKRAMSYLQYGLEQGEGFVVITGAVGTGKTLLIQTLSKALTSPGIVTGTIASSNLNEDEVLPAVAAAFDRPCDGRSRELLHQEIVDTLRSIGAHGGRALLIVDEAQLLTRGALEVLRILSNLETEGQALLQIFLVGQSELRNTLADARMEQLRQRVIASCELQPLGEKETAAYILHRLCAVGWRENPRLEPELFPLIQHTSRGIPRKINLIMGRLLLYGYLEELHELDSEALTTVLEEMEEELPSITERVDRPGNGASAVTDGSQSSRSGIGDLVTLEVTFSKLLAQVRKKIRQQEKL